MCMYMYLHCRCFRPRCAVSGPEFRGTTRVVTRLKNGMPIYRCELPVDGKFVTYYSASPPIRDFFSISKLGIPYFQGEFQAWIRDPLFFRLSM